MGYRVVLDPPAEGSIPLHEIMLAAEELPRPQLRHVRKVAKGGGKARARYVRKRPRQPRMATR